ncbi:hypothetical protein [Bradyrhizobium sp. ERR14]|uniref:hypothetical protein n=1 Tax=Bradyrhizobium sp. ERR14 TaxID=2663837 RepID=UPI00161615DB|nr:hypothetical protein [Bradyrhizobium sp. ERR14]MBB4394046.1 hypothetical protein [Bradyrhizobium sp. ERR14]
MFAEKIALDAGWSIARAFAALFADVNLLVDLDCQSTLSTDGQLLTLILIEYGFDLFGNFFQCFRLVGAAKKNLWEDSEGPGEGEVISLADSSEHL